MSFQLSLSSPPLPPPRRALQGPGAPRSQDPHGGLPPASRAPPRPCLRMEGIYGQVKKTSPRKPFRKASPGEQGRAQRGRCSHTQPGTHRALQRGYFTPNQAGFLKGGFRQQDLPSSSSCRRAQHPPSTPLLCSAPHHSSAPWEPHFGHGSAATAPLPSPAAGSFHQRAAGRAGQAAKIQQKPPKTLPWHPTPRPGLRDRGCTPRPAASSCPSAPRARCPR